MYSTRIATNTRAPVRASPLPNQTQGVAQPRKKKTAPQTGGPHQLGSQQGPRATHAKPGHAKRKKHKAQKPNTSRGAPTDKPTKRVGGPPHSLSNLATMAPENLQIPRTTGGTVITGETTHIPKNNPGNLVTQALEPTAQPARPLEDRPRAHEENQDINADVPDTKDHPTTRKH